MVYPHPRKGWPPGPRATSRAQCAAASRRQRERRGYPAGVGGPEDGTCNWPNKPVWSEHVLIFHGCRLRHWVQRPLQEHWPHHRHARGCRLEVDLRHVLSELLPQPHHVCDCCVVRRLFREIPHLVVAVGAAAFVRWRMIPATVAVQPKERAKGLQMRVTSSTLSARQPESPTP